MASVICFRKCACGIEFRVVNASDGRTQLLACECGREIQVGGSVEIASFSRTGPLGHEMEWVPVPRERIRGSSIPSAFIQLSGTC